MGFYKEPAEQNLADAKSAVRWIALALIFTIIAAISQLVWFVFLLTDNPNTMAAFIVMVGSFIVSRYCKWCSDSVRPENWKK